MTPYKQQQVLEWAPASMPDPFPHISHTREQGRWSQRNSCLESIGTRFRQWGNQWHLQGKEQRYRQPCSLLLLTKQEDAPYNWLDGKCTEKRYSKLHAALQTSQNIRTGMYGKLADRTRETKWNEKLIQQGHQTLSQCTHIVISIPDSKKIQFLKIQHKNQISRGETYKKCKRALPRKIIKILLTEIRVSTSWRDIPCSWIRRVTISNQNPSSFLMIIDKLILKFR